MPLAGSTPIVTAFSSTIFAGSWEAAGEPEALGDDAPLSLLFEEHPTAVNTTAVAKTVDRTAFIFECTFKMNPLRFLH
ncbi:hypothetical protein D3C87_1913220 [compost metagenome]